MGFGVGNRMDGTSTIAGLKSQVAGLKLEISGFWTCDLRSATVFSKQLLMGLMAHPETHEKVIDRRSQVPGSGFLTCNRFFEADHTYPVINTL